MGVWGAASALFIIMRKDLKIQKLLINNTGATSYIRKLKREVE